MKLQKVFITGGLGFIGLELARQLVGEGYRVSLFDNLSAQIHGALPVLNLPSAIKNDQVEIIRGDVAHQPDWASIISDATSVIHLAAETGTAQSMYEIHRYTETNVCGTASLLDYLSNQRHSVSKFVLASSRSIYGEGAYSCCTCGVVYPSMRNQDAFHHRKWQPICPACDGAIEPIPTPEDAPRAPASIYAATKLAQEDLVRITGEAIGLPTVIFRFQNVYGEGQSLKNPYTGILSIFSNQFRSERTVSIYEDGEETRDFIHVSDVAQAVALSLQSDRADGQTLNVGSGIPTSIKTLASMLKDRFGASTRPVISGQYRVGDIRHGYADMSRTSIRLGFKPLVSLDDGLDRFARWVRTQPIEPDRLKIATEQLISRGLMETQVPHHVPTV